LLPDCERSQPGFPSMRLWAIEIGPPRRAPHLRAPCLGLTQIADR
jgi:hypothetical protein